MQDRCIGVKSVVPPVPGDTRWFATLKMLEAFKASESAFILQTAQSNKMRPISPIDWKNATGYVEIMRYFEIATKIQEGEKYLTLSSLIPVLIVLRQKLNSYIQNRDNCGFGIGFAKNLLVSMYDRFGKYPNFMLLRPHCYATFSDPRFKWVFFQNKPEVAHIKDEIISDIKVLFETAQPTVVNNESANDSFWGSFEKCSDDHEQTASNSIESEIYRWGGLSRMPRETNPLPQMEGLQREYPHIYKVFRKYNVIPATQNRDERIFSLVARNTSAQCRNITVDSIEKKVIIASAIRSNGFIFDYTDHLNLSSESESESEPEPESDADL